MILGLGSLGELSPLGTLDHEDVSSSDFIPGSSDFPSSSEPIPSSELQPSSSEEPLPPLTDRYPEAPGNIFVGGIRIAWSHRDRLQQTASIIDQFAGNIGPEPGTTYTIRVYDLTTVQEEDVTDDQLIIEVEGITGTEQILYPPSEFAADVLIHLLSVRDGYESWQAHALLIFWVSEFALLSESELIPSSESELIPSSESELIPSSDGGIISLEDYMQSLGPDALWKLDETFGVIAIDSSGNERHGIYNGGVLAGQPLIQDGGKSWYSGSTGFIEFPVWNPTGSYTWLFFFSGLVGNLLGYLLNNSGLGDRGTRIAFGSNRSTNIRIMQSAAIQLSSSVENIGIAVHDGGMYMLSIRFDDSSGSMEIGLNADTRITKTNASMIGAAAAGNLDTLNPVRAGYPADSTDGNHHDGDYDTIAIYDRFLTDTELQTIFGLAFDLRPYLDLNDAILSHMPAGYWKFDEGGGSTANDSSGNGIHGTLVGTFTNGLDSLSILPNEPAGGSMDWTGSGARYITCGVDAWNPVGDFSILIFEFSPTNGDAGRYINTRGTVSDNGFWIGVNQSTGNNNWNCGVDNGAGQNIVISQKIIAATDHSQLCMICLRWNDSTGTLDVSINGILEQSSTNANLIGAGASGNLSNHTNQLIFGVTPNNFSQQLGAIGAPRIKIDSAAIFDERLTDNQLRQLYYLAIRVHDSPDLPDLPDLPEESEPSPGSDIIVEPGQHPGGLNYPAQFQQAANGIDAGTQPWASAWPKLLSFANSRLNEQPSAVQNYSVPPYYKNKTGHVQAKAIFQNDMFAAYACAAVYFINATRTGTTPSNDPYANKAVQILMDWAIKNKSLNPQPGTTSGVGDTTLVVSYAGPGMILAAEYIWDYPGWSSSQKSTFLAWVSGPVNGAAEERKLRHLVRVGNGFAHIASWSYISNHNDWGLCLSMHIAHLTDDAALMNDNIRLAKYLINDQITSSGSMPNEINRRENGVLYTSFALEAFTAALEIIRNMGAENLFDFVGAGGGSIRKALDFLYNRGIENPSLWPNNTPQTGVQNHTPELFAAVGRIYNIAKWRTWADAKLPVPDLETGVGWPLPTMLQPSPK